MFTSINVAMEMDYSYKIIKRIQLFTQKSMADEVGSESFYSVVVSTSC